MNLQKQKEEKKQNLVKASYDLFLSKGFSKTSIDEIVRKANVAKGTFYLYFKDKSEVMEEIVVKLSYQILKDAYQKMKAKNIPDFVDRVICLVDYIIEFFKKNTIVLKLLERNFSWPLIREKLEASDDQTLNEMMNECFYNPYLGCYSKEETYKIAFIIIEMVGSICFTSIIKQRPAPIDEMKPVLYRMIEKILR